MDRITEITARLETLSTLLNASQALVDVALEEQLVLLDELALLQPSPKERYMMLNLRELQVLFPCKQGTQSVTGYIPMDFVNNHLDMIARIVKDNNLRRMCRASLHIIASLRLAASNCTKSSSTNLNSQHTPEVSLAIKIK